MVHYCHYVAATGGRSSHKMVAAVYLKFHNEDLFAMVAAVYQTHVFKICTNNQLSSSLSEALIGQSPTLDGCQERCQWCRDTHWHHTGYLLQGLLGIILATCS